VATHLDPQRFLRADYLVPERLLLDQKNKKTGRKILVVFSGLMVEIYWVDA
jgi:hypothetical protein